MLWLGMLLITFVFSGVFTSCRTFSTEGLSQGINPGGGSYEILADFTEREWVNKFIGSSGGTNMFNITSRATEGVINRVIQKNLREHGGTGVINLEISYGSNPVQWFLNTLTFKLWAPSTVTVRGTVIKQN